MGLNASKVKAPVGDRVEQEVLKAGNYPARVVQVIDLGLQTQRPYKGEDKPPKHCIQMTYELSHEFMKDKDGNAEEDRPRWINEDFPFNSLQSELAKSTKRYLAIDPEQEAGGDFTKIVGMPCTVTVVNNPGSGKHKGKVFSNIGNVTGPTSMPGYEQPELVNDPRCFALDEPDMEVWGTLPEWIQNKIKDNLEFKGSPLDVALGGEVKVPKQEEEGTEGDPY